MLSATLFSTPNPHPNEYRSESLSRNQIWHQPGRSRRRWLKEKERHKDDEEKEEEDEEEEEEEGGEEEEEEEYWTTTEIMK